MQTRTVVRLKGDELVNTPSKRDGIKAEVEYNNRVYACELIATAGVMLKL